MSDIALPARTDACWRDVATGKISRTWTTLAMKILMTRVLRETSVDPSPTNVQRCANEIHSFFEKNAKIAQGDLAMICR
jgi:hypothetical protein